MRKLSVLLVDDNPMFLKAARDDLHQGTQNRFPLVRQFRHRVAGQQQHVRVQDHLDVGDAGFSGNK